ncbi:MAG: primary-amine oxidase [Rhodothermales bacterium]|nr:primary-amine oxidase [Rhodothermales bacterium]
MSLDRTKSVTGLVILAALVFGTGTISQAQAQLPAHPLDQLTAAELEMATHVLRAAGYVDENTRFHLINLHEPAKADVLRWEPGATFQRQAFAVLKKGHESFEAVVDVANGEIISWRQIAGVQPNLTDEELVAGGEIAKTHPEWQAAMRQRGIADFESILCAAVSPGYYGVAEEAGRRLGKAFCYDLTKGANFWARPIEGLTTIVDLNTMEVVRVIDTGPVPVPTAPADYDERAVDALREIPTSIAVEQPNGPAFTVNGNEVSWQSWRFHFRVDPRVGLVVSRVRYVDDGNERSILYQGSLSELFVPYMDPDLGWYFRTYMDAGEFLVGISTVPLQPGLDCPENARYFDAVLADPHGKPVSKERAVCLFERYAGDVAWRHFDFLTGETESRRKRDLVLRLIATLGNYDYIFDWTFEQNGTIRVGAGASGTEQVKAVARRTANEPGGREDARYGRFVSEHTVAINHDHFFSFRLDLDVDGPANSLLREKFKTELLGKDHARRSVWVLEPEIARVEADAKLRIDFARPALWRVINATSLGPVGYPVSYEVKPSANAVSLMSPDDFPQRRAGFIDHHLWVTPYNPDELYAAGRYPYQSQGGDGLPAWTSANRTIENTDIVLWYTLGMHHVVRAEDWPILPTSWTSFELRPFDFFDRNPALDLPGTREVSDAGSR